MLRWGAKEIVFPVGYRNTFGHPRADVVERYRQTGAGLHRTDMSGAITVELGAQKLVIKREREERQRYWHGA